MKSGFALFLLLLLWALTFCLKAQHPVYRHYTVDDGLLNFQNFDKQDGLPENTVFEIYEDSRGRVWFVSFPCQLSYFSDGVIQPYKFNHKLKALAGNGFIPVKGSFLVTEVESLFISFLLKGLYCIDYQGNMTQQNRLEDQNGLRIVEKDRKLLVSQTVDKSLKDFADIHTDLISKKITLKRSTNYSYPNVYVSKDDKAIFIARNEFITRINSSGIVDGRNMINRVIYIKSDSNNNLWVGTDKSGVFCFSQGNILEKPALHYLNNYSISSVLFDNEGGKWFGSLEDGVFYLPSSAFSTYTDEDGLTNNKINALAFFQEKITIGTHDPYINILYKGILSHRKVSESLNGTIFKLLNEDDKILWIGTNDYLYSISNGIKEKHVNERHSKTPKQSRSVFSIKDFLVDSRGRLVIGESKSLSIFNDGRVQYNSFYDDDFELRIEAVEEIDNDKFLLGSNNGLWEYSNGKYRNLSKNSPEFNNRITDIAFVKRYNFLALGTKGSGLIVKHNDSILLLTKAQGLSSNSVSSLLIIKNHLWVATNYGLNEMDIEKIGTKDFKITSYFKHNGLVSNEINQIAGDSTNIYIATNQGLTVFDYHSYQPVLVPPPIYISAFGVMKKDTTIKSGIKLSSSQNLITIKFIGISFREAASLKYKYRLKGLDSKWNYTSNTEVEYAFLPPGTYDFEVLAINSEGVMSKMPANISFTIMPPFWKTWWFILIVLLTLAAGSYFYYINRLKQIKKEHELRNDIDWYRQQALAKQMDPHFVFNTLNSIQSFIIKNDRLASSQYLSKFARLMRLILNSSQKQAVPLSDEISALTLYLELESLRFQQKFDFNLVVDPSIDSSACFIPAFLIQPFVENAIWHGIMGLKVTGRIDIEFQKNLNKITCIVEDNGIGRQRSMELKTPVQKAKQSYGIALVVSRLELLNNLYNIDMKIQFIDLFAENGQSSGTRVIIQLPMIS
ncbi:MAG: histidine kinase [Bacteroidales bacterium]|nr:histidine kinase [Bacteroidales bacterium]